MKDLLIEQKEQDFFDRVDYEMSKLQKTRKDCDMCDGNGLIELTNGDCEPYAYRVCDHIER